jgi:hypothetical protein
MKQPQLEHHTKRMWVAVLLGIAYSSVFLYMYTLTGSTTLDGSIGVLLVLYIGSYPAARLLDMLYMQSRPRFAFVSSDAGIFWLAVTITVLLAAMITIFVGANRSGIGICTK